MTSDRVSIIRFLGWSMAVVALTLLVSCKQPEVTAPTTSEPPPLAADVTASAAAAADGTPASKPRPVRTLAYQHTVSVELGKAVLSARMREVQNACTSREELGCTLLDISLDEQSEVPSASIVLRLAPGQVDPMVQIAAHGGRILSRSTHAEDLAQPMADTERQISLLTMHRDRLSEFLKHPDLKIQEVLELSREISSAQTQIETLGATKTNLQRRIDTELLTLRLSPPEGAYRSVQTPIRNALRSFGDDFSSTLAVLIRLFAILLPLILVLVPVAALWYFFKQRSSS
jgi:hypothetical protein